MKDDKKTVKAHQLNGPPQAPAQPTHFKRTQDSGATKQNNTTAQSALSQKHTKHPVSGKQ